MALGTTSTGRDISAIMRKVHSINTSPEVAFHEALEAQGLQYLTSPPDLPGKPDVVLPDKRLAIFIDGDFWHGGQWRRRNLARLEDQFQKTGSREYWLKKIRRNMGRDCVATAALLATGWTVLRFWESDIRRNLGGCIAMSLDVVEQGVRKSPYSLLPQKTFAEFFAGIGLMRMGLERQGWSVAFANDNDEQKHRMYRAQFPDADSHLLPDDVQNVQGRVPVVSLATASFPCNDLSLAGARQGLDGEQSGTFWPFIHAIEAMGEQKPPLVLLENVPGFLTSHKGEDFTEALLTLNRLGYKVDAFILDAVHFVPQSRERLFVVGVLQEEGEPQGVEDAWFLEAPQFRESDMRPKALADFIRRHREIRWSVRDLPDPPASTKRLEDILEDLPEDAPEWWSAERAEYLLNQMSRRHREIADQMIARPAWSYGTVFRRMRNNRSMAELRTDGIAGCLRTPRGGSAKQILFKAGYGRYFARLITPREAARLMGADDYAITVSRDQALFGFGDAVCVPVIEWIATYYLNPLVNELVHGRALHLVSQ